MKYRLSDDVIAQVAKLIQLAILTGTDLTDNLRTLELIEEDGHLFLTKEYKDSFDQGLDRMMKELNENLQGAQELKDATTKGPGFFN